MILLQAFIGISKAEAISSAVDNLESLWVQSLLAEYDLNLRDKYGLFGFYGYPKDVENKILFYASESFDEKKYINVNSCACRLYDYSLNNVKIATKQIIAEGKAISASKVIGKEPDDYRVQSIPGGALMQNDAKDAFEELPSGGNSGTISFDFVKNLFQETASFGDVLKTQGNRFFINQYISQYINNYCNSESFEDSYLKCEREYLICGKHSDSANIKGVKNLIVAMRQVSNMAFLHTDSKKSKAILAAAELIAPEAPMLSYETIIAAWALAESINDYKLLINGHKVPLVKTTESWALDLDVVLDSWDEKCVYTGVDSGESYDEYLSLLTYVMDEKVLILRIMDIVQLNMRYKYYDSFRIKDYNGGLELMIQVNGKDHVYKKEY